MNLTGRGFVPLLGFLRTVLPGVATGTLPVAIGRDARRSPRSRLALSGCLAVGVVVASVLAWRALGALPTGPSVGDGLFFGVYVAGALAAVVLWAVSVWTT